MAMISLSLRRASHLLTHLRRKPRNRQHTPRILLQRVKPLIMSQQLGHAELFALDPVASNPFQLWSADKNVKAVGRGVPEFLGLVFGFKDRHAAIRG
jgi:hypothetical protein